MQRAVPPTPLGHLVFVLHTHLPWVLGHGRWPHGEAWLYEATAECYLPILRLLDRLEEEGRKGSITIGITPVLSEMLATPRFRDGFLAYLEERTNRAEADQREFDAAGDDGRRRAAAAWSAFYGGAKADFAERYNQARLTACTRLPKRERVVSMRLGTERAFLHRSRTHSPRPAGGKSQALRGTRGPASRSGVRTTDIRGTAPTWSFIANMGWTACGTGVSRTGSSPCERRSPTTPTPRRSEPPPMRTILHRWSSRLSMSIRRPRAEPASSSRRSTRNSLATGGSRAQRGWRRFCENWRDTSMRSLPRIFSRRILPARPSKFRKDRGAKEAITMSG